MNRLPLPDYELPGIYEIRNTRSGAVYIGSSVNIRKRIIEHEAALKRGDHDIKGMSDDYAAGDSFTVTIIKRIHTRFIKELQAQEAEEIKRRNENGEMLYNRQPILSRYTSTQVLVDEMADRYCRARFGKPLYMITSKCPAEIDMLYKILKCPDREQDIRDEYAEVISYQSHRRYYSQRGKDYDIEMENLKKR